MCNSTVTELPTVSNSQPPLTPQIGGQYLLSWDIAPETAAGFLRGVILRDGEAVAAYYRQDGAGEYLETAFDGDDTPIPAPADWEQHIIRAVGTPAASPSPEGGALVDPLAGDDDDDLAAWAATQFPPGVCACGRPIEFGATACLDCDPDQYESDALFALYPGTRYEVAA